MKIKMLFKINILKTIFYNFFSRHVKREKKSHLIIYRKVKFHLCKHSIIYLKQNCCLHIGNCPGIDGYGLTSIVLCKNSKWINNENTFINCGSTIVVHENALLETDANSINHSCCIKCKEHIVFGHKTIFGRGTQILHSDFHTFSIDDIKKNNTKPIFIGAKVWVGVDCIILKGVHIGDNCIIGAKALVNKDVPSNSIVHTESILNISQKKIDWI